MTVGSVLETTYLVNHMADKSVLDTLNEQQRSNK